MPTPTSAAAQRILTEAARLFSERGYAATSVADIQLACGLSAGSGALYKHFSSKQALLAAVVDIHVETMRAGSLGGIPEDLGGALWFIARAVQRGMLRDREVLRVLLRDLDGFPDLLDRVWAEVRSRVYDGFAGWLLTASGRGTVRVDGEPRVVAAVLLASLTAYPILDALIGHVPGDIEAEAFLEGWVRQARAVLDPTPAGSRPG